MIIETYIDAKDLTNKQSLIIAHGDGKRQDVLEALSAQRSRTSRVVLERWKIELGEPPGLLQQQEQMTNLATVYKMGIVLFRSLVSYSNILPAYRLSRQRTKSQAAQNPKVKYRILSESELSPPDLDPLLMSLDGSQKVSSDFPFGTIDSPAGSLSITVSYRTNCKFHVEDSEALLSSQFMGADDDFFKPSLPGSSRQRLNRPPLTHEAGSLPAGRQNTDRPDMSQAYGSMSTFHQIGAATGTSPLSALRAVRDAGSTSPAGSPPRKVPPSIRSGQGSFASLRSAEGGAIYNRRQSISFQPFKAPPLSASPSLADVPLATSPRIPGGRLQPSALAESRSIPSATTNPAALARRPISAQYPAENAIASSGSGSPKPSPMTRYSSSFSHRRSRISSGGPFKLEDDSSSGRASAASTAQPGSGMLNQDAGQTSSGSFQGDDENITDFLKMLDLKRDLLTSETSANEESARRTAAALSRFQRMRDSNVVLTDSLSSSIALHRSSSTSSRHLSSVPAMLAGTSLSTASSPGKPISPHTPHTPINPSRLSANSIVDYSHHEPTERRRHRLSIVEHGSQTEDTPSDSTTMESGTTNPNAIDIPTSPRFNPAYRRSSSVAQRHRTSANDDDLGDLYPFGQRSASVGTEDRPSLSLSALVSQQENVAQSEDQDEEETQRPPNREPTDDRGRSITMEKQFFGPHLPQGSGATGSGSTSSSNQPYQPRFGRGAKGRGLASHESASSSIAADREQGGSTGSGTSDRRIGGGRFSFSRPNASLDEDEGLLFAMSDFGASRRSIEEGRGGPTAGAGERERERGNLGSAPDSPARRGSRRGGLGSGGYNAWS